MLLFVLVKLRNEVLIKVCRVASSGYDAKETHQNALNATDVSKQVKRCVDCALKYFLVKIHLINNSHRCSLLIIDQSSEQDWTRLVSEKVFVFKSCQLI